MRNVFANVRTDPIDGGRRCTGYVPERPCWRCSTVARFRRDGERECSRFFAPRRRVLWRRVLQLAMNDKLTSYDDFPVHQSAELIAHSATSDRNFYDRYYFNMYPENQEFFAIFGLGQYPNLGTKDAFIDVRTDTKQHIVRSSAPLTDRMDLSVGPFRIEVIKPLEMLRVIVEPTEHSVSMDVVFEGNIEAVLEPRQTLRLAGKLVFDTNRLAQTGNWTGLISIDGVDHQIDGSGNRDRSWGIRPVGEPEPAGIREGMMVLPGMWNYFPMQFEDHTIFYICHQDDDGVRHLVQSERIWHDRSRPHDDLGPAEFSHTVEEGTRIIRSSTLTFPEANIAIECKSVLPNFVSLGTGYGMDADWRHGMYQGPDTVTQGLVLDCDEIQGLAQYGIIDHLAEVSYDGRVGHGLLEQGFFGPFRAVGIMDGINGATK